MAAPYRRLLLATEHSVYDGGAETLALALARAWALPLQAVLPVLGNPEFEAVAPQLAARADAQAAARRESLQAMAQALPVPLSVLVRPGPEVSDIVLRAAHETRADLIVIRRRGRRGMLARLLVGEMVTQVLAQAPCSVLIVPRGARLWRQGVLVGIEPGAAGLAAAPGLVQRAGAIAAAAGLPLHVACVVDDAAQRPQAEQALAAARACVQAGGPAVEAVLLQGRAHEALMQHAQACGADLLVVARGGGGRAWSQGTAQKIAGLAECAVLVAVEPAPAP